MVAEPHARPAAVGMGIGEGSPGEGASTVSPTAPDLDAPDDEPPDILRPGDASRGERWAAIHTRSRCEKRVAQACENYGIRAYLPLYEHHTGNSRRRTYQLPLLPNYLFACLDPDTRLEVLRCGRIVRMLWPNHEDTLLGELSQIRAALEASVDLVVGPGVSRGDLVRVVCGPLKGIEGVISHRVRRRDRDRLVLNVWMVRFCASAEIDLRHVEPVRRVKCSHHHSQAGEVSAAHR